jgi:hypothetical protein
MAAKKSNGRNAQIRNIWGLAKELNLDKDNLYAIIEGLTGKDSIKQLTTRERNTVIMDLGHMKDGHKRKGQLASDQQIWKIHELEKQLGWEGEPARLHGYLKKRFGVENIRWITGQQAWKVIEGLKKMAEREANRHGV